MKAILKREIKNFLKNPIFWAGLLIMVAGIYQILQPYLELHYFTSNAEIQNMSVSSLEDADVMEGYIPVSDEERTENGYEEIYRTMTEDMGLTTEEANEAISSIRGMNTEEACDYLEKEYRYYGAQYSLEGSKYKQGDANEVNTYIQKKMQEHPYSYYFARKYADFAGLFMAFFATILLAFLFLRDTRKDTYELPRAYWGRGYMTEALAAMVRCAFERKHVDVLAIGHFQGNHRSRRVIEKCGFQYEGTIRQGFRRYDGQVFDDVCYSILKEEYFAHPQRFQPQAVKIPKDFEKEG